MQAAIDNKTAHLLVGGRLAPDTDFGHHVGCALSRY
jgi:hypothetical protein